MAVAAGAAALALATWAQDWPALQPDRARGPLIDDHLRNPVWKGHCLGFGPADLLRPVRWIGG